MTRNSLRGIGLCLIAAAPACGDVIFQDGTFSNTDWGVMEVFGTGTAGSMQVLAGGNPGAFRHLTNNLGEGPGASLRVFHYYGASQATRYEPGVSGAITSIDFSIDYLPIAGPPGGQGIAFALRQAQVVYFAAPLAIGNNPVWQNHSVSLIPTQFLRADGAPGIPNFTSGGAPIRFGLLTYNSANGAGTPFSTDAGYDNFFVRVVPSPAAGAVLAVAAAFLPRRRRSVDPRLPGTR